MKAIKIILFVLMILPEFSFAGEVYGTLRKESGPCVNYSVRLKNKDTDILIKDSHTDEKGNYSVYVSQAGDYILEVLDEKGIYVAKIVIFSNDSSSNYNLVLVNENNKWQLKFQ